MRRFNFPQSGFTLFEVLIAVSVFAVIGALTMTNLIQVGRTGERVSDMQQQLSDIQFALGYLGKDLTQMVDRKVRDQYGDEQAQLIVKEEAISFTRAGWANLLQQSRSNLQRVEYKLEDNTLKRIFWPQLDQGYIEQKIEQEMLQGVEAFEVKLLTTGKETIDFWPLEVEPQTEDPVALEFTLELNGFGEIRRVYELNDVLS